LTLRMYANRKGWDLQEVTVHLNHDKLHAQDCADCETKEGKIDQIDREIELKGNLDESQIKRLIEIADRCPVHRTLHSEVKVRTKLRK
ncbi:MAG: OsmC family protein, partial [Bacteroidota bacterium]